MILAALVAVSIMTAPGEAAASTRSLKIYFTHTKERAEITYKRNGRYIQSGLDQLNHILRDWRQNEPTRMDPRLFDLLWEVYQASGSNDYIHIVSAYRSPKTNGMLRSRSSGVAKNSQHKLGRAIDFFLPDVPVSKVRALGMKFQVGGVGYYPNSGWPFVHLDTGSVRAWPRMSKQELLALFPEGKTLHVPPSGERLAGYETALADYQRRVTSTEIAVAGGGSGGGNGGGGRNLIAMLFGNNGDEDEDPAAIAQPQRAAVPQRQAPQPAPQMPQQAPVAVASVLPASTRAPIPVSRPVIGQVPAPQVASLAPIGGTPPAPVQMAAAEIPAPALEVPAIPEEEQYADLSGLAIPVPEFRSDRSGISVYAAEDAPEMEGRDMTETLIAAAEMPTDGLTTALVPRPEERPEFAAIAAATTGLGNGAAAPTPSSEAAADAASIALADAAGEEAAAIELAALTPPPPGNGNGKGGGNDNGGGLGLRMLGAAGSEIVKGNRPTAADASEEDADYVVSEPQLTERMVSEWALARTSLSDLGSSVKSPRFVSRELRAVPEMVYTTGFSAETVEANRFTGAAVNFMTVARFED